MANAFEPGMYKPEPRQCALLLARLLEAKGETRSRALTRARISELTLKRLWVRNEVTAGLLRAVNEWLTHAGWVVFRAGGSYAALQISVIESWPRTSSKRLAGELREVQRGTFDFGPLERLLTAAWD